MSSRAQQFNDKLILYGEDVNVTYNPSTAATNRCTCWAYGYPDPDCDTCGGDGYVTAGATATIKAFVLPTTSSDKILQLGFGSLPIGKGNIYVSSDVDLDAIKNVLWNERTYVVRDPDYVAIANEIVYRCGRLERVED